jgi:hypothetical protein
MTMHRREMLIAALGLAAAGCVPAQRSSRSGSTSIWPDSTPRPSPSQHTQNAYPQPQTTVATPTRRPAPAPRAAESTPVAVGGLTGIVARKSWTSTGLAGRNINAMKGVNKITIHHEGWTKVDFTDAASTFDRIEKIRQIHTRDRGWADIGYHFVIDRAGRVIQGREARYQGAHVSENNPHNIGILVLGNFDEQRPSTEQLRSLSHFSRVLVKQYRLGKNRVFTHQEINPTQCPGRHLQAQIEGLRRHAAIG